MLAIGLAKYGSLDGLTRMELPLPEPASGEVRVKVHASALNPADYKVGTGEFKFLHARNFPLILGYDFSGVIEAVGSNVEWKVSDAVFGFLPYSPFNRRGAFAEALIAKADEIAAKPASVSHLQAAAAATSGLTAIQSLRDVGKFKGPSGRVLITGVSGGVGSIAISIARKLGADVVAIGSGRGLDLAKTLGAVSTINRKGQNVFAEAKGPFDVVFDAAAAYSWTQWQTNIKPGGMYVTTLPALSLFADKLKTLFAPSGTGFVNVRAKAKDLSLLASWLAADLVVTIDSTISKDDLAKGLEKLRRGEVVGRIAVDML